MTNKQRDIIRRSILARKEHQLYCAIEELSELQKELCKALREKPNKWHIAEELADVIIISEIIKQCFELDDADILRNRVLMKHKLTDFIKLFASIQIFICDYLNHEVDEIKDSNRIRIASLLADLIVVTELIKHQFEITENDIEDVIVNKLKRIS